MFFLYNICGLQLKISIDWNWKKTCNHKILQGTLSLQWDSLITDAVNSLALGRSQSNFREIIFKLNLVNGGWGISYKITLGWMPLDLTDDKSTLVTITAWCRQATSHYLSQCWPRSMSSNGVTRPQWVKSFRCVNHEIGLMILNSCNAVHMQPPKMAPHKLYSMN